MTKIPKWILVPHKCKYKPKTNTNLENDSLLPVA